MRWMHMLAALIAALVMGGCGADEIVVSESIPGPYGVVSPVDPGPPGEWGVEPDVPAAARSAVEWLNVHREAASLPWLEHDSILDYAASGHANFVILNPDPYTNGLSMHDEVAGLPGFVAEKYWDRVASMNCDEVSLGEVISQQASPFAGVVQWIESVYHRLPLLSASAGMAGYGHAVGGVDHVAVMEITQRPGSPVAGAVAWPFHGADDVPVSWDGKEVPQPPAPSSGFPSGPVFTLSFPSSAAPIVTSHALLDEAGFAIAHQLLTPGNDPYLKGLSVLALYADAPLATRTVHTVQLKGWVGDQPFEWTSVFRTAGAGDCDVLDARCPTGRTCYPAAEGGSCAWEGTTRENGACTFQNDCVAGTSCVEGSCRRLCSLDDSAGGCAATCVTGHAALSGMIGVGVCAPGPCDVFRVDSCSEGRVCSPQGCVSVGELSVGGTCTLQSDCGGGLACVQAYPDRAICLPRCDPHVAWDPQTSHPPCHSRCPGGAHHITDGTAVCLP